MTPSSRDVGIEVRDGCGRRGELFIRYYDLSMMTASFPAPLAVVQKILPTGSLKAVRVTPDMTVVNLSAFEYRHIDQVAPYNEFRLFVKSCG